MTWLERIFSKEHCAIHFGITLACVVPAVCVGVHAEAKTAHLETSAERTSSSNPGSIVRDHQPGGVTIFEGQALQALPYTTLEELLRHDVGIELSSQSLHGRLYFPAFRGVSEPLGTGIVVQIDGQRIDDPYFGSPFTFLRHSPVAQIEKLSIYRGLAASEKAPEARDGQLFVMPTGYPSRGRAIGLQLELSP